MEKIEEILKTITSYFNILLGVLAASLALWLSPNVDNYQGALLELNTLKNINKNEYKKFIGTCDVRYNFIMGEKPGAKTPEKKYSIFWRKV